jgi:DNA repair exonuclease SbcCD nuclease subunit
MAEQPPHGAIMVVSDLHLDRLFAVRTLGATGIPEAWEVNSGVLQEIRQIVDEYEVSAVVFAGDIFDTAFPKPEPQERLADFIKSLPTDCPSVLVLGNHELLGLPPGQRTCLRRFCSTSLVFDADCDVAQLYGRAEGVQLLVGPWPSPALYTGPYDREQLATWLSRLNAAADRLAAGMPAVAVAHAEVESDFHPVAWGSNISVDPGALHALPVSQVALGHIHHRYVFTPKVHYVGAPNRLKFGDDDEPTGVSLIEPQTGATYFVPTKTARRLRTIRQWPPTQDEQERIPGAWVRVILPTELFPDISHAQAASLVTELGGRMHSFVRQPAAMFAESEANGTRAVEQAHARQLVMGAQSDPAPWILQWAYKKMPQQFADEHFKRAFAACLSEVIGEVSR